MARNDCRADASNASGTITRMKRPHPRPVGARGRPSARASAPDGTLARIELAERLPSLRVPTPVLAGPYDRITPPVVQRKIAQAIPGARLVVFEKSGHRPEFEEAALWSRIVGDFLPAHLPPETDGPP